MTIVSSDKVEVIAKYLLQCANKSAVAALGSPFKLGPIDQMVLPFVPIEVVFVYKKPGSSTQSSSILDELIPVERLWQALCYLLDYYPHLTGRLSFIGDGHVPEVTRLGEGAELLEAQCGLRLDDLCPSTRASGRLVISDLPAAGTALLAPFSRTIEGVCRDPIFAVQHTRFSCGGVALGIRLHHIMCDAHGFFQLARDMAEIYRALRPSLPPVLACPPEIRSYLRNPMSLEETQEAIRYQPAMYYLEGSDRVKPEVPALDAEPLAGPPVSGRVLRFSGPKLRAIKELATNPSGKGWVSTFEALSAYLYQQIYRARVKHLETQGVTVSEAASQLSRGFLASIDIRDPHRLNLPARYFPNAIYCPFTYSPHELVADSPLWQVTESVHNLIRSVEPEHMAKTPRWIAAQPDKGRIKLNYSFFNGSFIASQWSKFDMYVGVDFDADESGKPLPPSVVGPPFTRLALVDGLALFLSTEEQFYRVTGQDGSCSSSKDVPCAVDVQLTLNEALWSILDEDKQFRGFCS